MNAVSLDPSSQTGSPAIARVAAPVPSPEASPAIPVAALPRCRCGTDRTSRAASPERDYSLAGTCYLLWGGTSIPTCVRFRCIHCGDVFDECTDRATMRAYVT